MIFLSSLELNPNMLWEDKNKFSSIQQEVIHQIAEPIIYTAKLEKGRPITLKAMNDGGWFSYGMVNQLQEMADTQGGEFPLIINEYSFRVMFRHQDAPAFSATNLIPRATPQDGDYFTGTLKLMTI